MVTVEDVLITEVSKLRAILHGGDVDVWPTQRDTKSMIPLTLFEDDVVKCAEFAELRDLSHDLPQSTHPELANDDPPILCLKTLALTVLEEQSK